MKPEDVPPPFQGPRPRPEALPLFEEMPLPVEPPDAAAEAPQPELPDPFLRRS